MSKRYSNIKEKRTPLEFNTRKLLVFCSSQSALSWLMNCGVLWCNPAVVTAAFVIVLITEQQPSAQRDSYSTKAPKSCSTFSLNWTSVARQNAVGRIHLLPFLLYFKQSNWMPSHLPSELYRCKKRPDYVWPVQCTKWTLSCGNLVRFALASFKCLAIATLWSYRIDGTWGLLPFHSSFFWFILIAPGVFNPVYPHLNRTGFSPYSCEDPPEPTNINRYARIA